MCLLLVCGAPHTPRHLIKVKPVKIIVLCSGINQEYSIPLVEPLGCSVLLAAAIINSVCLCCWAEEKRDVFASGPIHINGKKTFYLDSNSKVQTLELDIKSVLVWLVLHAEIGSCVNAVGMQKCCHFGKWRWKKLAYVFMMAIVLFGIFEKDLSWN